MPAKEEAKTIGAGDENQDRGNWDRKSDYILSCVGYAVGLGNVWRFPYLAFENGGAAFLVPYVIMLVFAGLPVFFLECSLGQFSSMGPISAFKFSPILKGIGVCMVVLNIFVSIYYNVIIAYTVFYFFASLTSELPWSNCGNWWNTEQCSTVFESTCGLNLTAIDRTVVDSFLAANNFSANATVIPTVPLSLANDLAQNLTLNRTEIGCVNVTVSRGVSASEEFWENYALERSANIDETGTVVTSLCLSLLIAWIVVYFSMIRGIKSSGKVVYFTALFPYAVLLILLIRGATLEGAYEGIQFYIGNKSDWKRIGDAEVWQKAATQIFFSLSAAWGGLIALSSYNKFHNNCYHDSIIVVTVNCATSLFAGFAIFTVVGHMAHRLGRPVNEVVQSGFSLAFVAYPEAITQLPISPLWAILFFLMLFTLGLDSQFTGVESILTCASDLFPRQLRTKRGTLTLAFVIIMFFLGMTCVTQAGIYWLNLIDTFSAGWGLLFIAILECVGVSWVYGGNRFIEDIEMMIGKKNWWFWLYWRACWFFITPLLLIAILTWSLITLSPPEYAGVFYPPWANALGWCIVASGLAWVPIMALIAIIKSRGNLFKAAAPAADWGPYLKQFRGERYANMQEPDEAVALHKGDENGTEMSGKPNAAYHHEEAHTKM